MSIKITAFEWDEFNTSHLEQAHPDLDRNMLEEIVSNAKEYVSYGKDRYGKKIYAVRRGRLVVLFNIKPGRVARIFSIREL
jgi:hypothetical protein